MSKLTTEIGARALQDPTRRAAVSTCAWRVTSCSGYFFARMAAVALKKIAAGSTDPFYTAKLQTARFYFARLFPETATLGRAARAGSAALMDTDAALA